MISDYGGADESHGGSRMALEGPVVTSSRKGSFDDPTFEQDDERCNSSRFTISSFQVPVLATAAARFSVLSSRHWRRCARLGERDEECAYRERGARRRDPAGAAEQTTTFSKRPSSIDEKMPSTARDLLAASKPCGSSAEPPFLAALAL